MQAYSLFPDDLRMVLATFLSEFHGATLWHGDAPDLILMAPSPSSEELLHRAQAFYATGRLPAARARCGARGVCPNLSQSEGKGRSRGPPLAMQYQNDRNSVSC